MCVCREIKEKVFARLKVKCVVLGTQRKRTRKEEVGDMCCVMGPWAL